MVADEEGGVDGDEDEEGAFVEGVEGGFVPDGGGDEAGAPALGGEVEEGGGAGEGVFGGGCGGGVAVGGGGSIGGAGDAERCEAVGGDEVVGDLLLAGAEG